MVGYLTLILEGKALLSPQITDTLSSLVKAGYCFDLQFYIVDNETGHKLPQTS